MSQTHNILYRRAFGAFLLVYMRPPKMLDENDKEMVPTELKSVIVSSSIATGVYAIYSSGIFYWFTYATSDCRNINRPEVEEFPFYIREDQTMVLQSLSILSKMLWSDMEKIADGWTTVTSLADVSSRLFIQDSQKRLSIE